MALEVEIANMPCKTRGDSHLFQLSNLFRYAHGDVRCVKLQQPLDEFYYCISDVIRIVCEVGSERATEIWKTLPDSLKSALPAGSIAEFIFHRSAVPVATYTALKQIIGEIKGSKADNFRAIHSDIFSTIPSACSPSPLASPCPPPRTFYGTQSKIPALWEKVDSTGARGDSQQVAGDGGVKMEDDGGFTGMDCDPPVEEKQKDKKRKPALNTMSGLRSRCDFTSNLLHQYKIAQETIPNAAHRDQMCAELMNTLKMLPDGDDAFAVEAKSSVGYVYCLVSDAYPGRVKLGRTKNLDERLSALNTGCAPKPLRVALSVKTLNPMRDEKRTHTYFASVRREGEYFQTSVAEVRAFFDEHITPDYIKELEIVAGI